MRRTSSCGFSLIELMVTIAVLAVLLGLGAPPLADYLTNAKIRSTADIVRTSMHQARQEAVKRNGLVRVDLSGLTLTSTLIALDGTPTVLETVSAPVGVTVLGPDSIAFAGNGRTSPTGTTAVFQINRTDATCKANGGPVPCLAIQIGTGGLIKTCDPAQATGIQSCQ